VECWSIQQRKKLRIWTELWILFGGVVYEENLTKFGWVWAENLNLMLGRLHEEVKVINVRNMNSYHTLHSQRQLHNQAVNAVWIKH
jgi:hypothetical protein